MPLQGTVVDDLSINRHETNLTFATFSPPIVYLTPYRFILQACIRSTSGQGVTNYKNENTKEILYKTNQRKALKREDMNKQTTSQKVV